MNFKFAYLGVAIVVTGTMVASAEVLDRPGGLRIGQRMTLRPYVSASITYDSNVSGQSGNSAGQDDVLWTINPGLGLTYQAENWALLFQASYSYHAYTKQENVNTHNEHNITENLRWNWENSKGGEKGWALMLMQSFQQMSMADDMDYGNAGYYDGDRRQLNIAGAVQRRFNEHWHSDLNASYYWLKYDNDINNRSLGAMYGWQRWNFGLEGGFAPSRWTDILGAVAYQGYNQDNSFDGMSQNSWGLTAQVGLGTYATERISYRALAGWSRFEYGNSNTDAANGFIYTLSGSWKISDTWTTMLLGSSYYQPSEREVNTRSRVDSFSWGLAKSMIRGKLSATLDITYRHETQESVAENSNFSDYDLDILSGRLGLNYTLNRFLGLFCYGEYQRSWNSENDQMNGYGDYDRWRITGGLRVTY